MNELPPNAAAVRLGVYQVQNVVNHFAFVASRIQVTECQWFWFWRIYCEHRVQPHLHFVLGRYPDHRVLYADQAIDLKEVLEAQKGGSKQSKGVFELLRREMG